MTEESKYRMILALGLVNKLYEVFQMLANEEIDGRFNGYMTQSYGLKQDLEDKLREDFVDGPIQIASAPNLPNSGVTQNTNTGTIPTGNPNPGTPTTNNPNPVAPATNNFGSDGSDSVNQPNQNGVTHFFSNILSGKASNNSDLNDFLNQITAQNASDNATNSNAAPF